MYIPSVSSSGLLPAALSLSCELEVDTRLDMRLGSPLALALRSDLDFFGDHFFPVPDGVYFAPSFLLLPPSRSPLDWLFFFHSAFFAESLSFCAVVLGLSGDFNVRSDFDFLMCVLFL